MSIRPRTNEARSVRELQDAAHAALLALHHHDPALLLELADILDHAADLHATVAGKGRCTACEVKQATASLLRCVAALRGLVDLGLAPPVGNA